MVDAETDLIVEPVTENEPETDLVVEPVTENESDTETDVENTNTIDWTKDERYNGEWKQNQNNMYQSYKNYEDDIQNKYKPIEENYNVLSQKFQDNGIDPSQLDDYLDHYKELADPENPVTIAGNYLSKLLENPATKDTVENFLVDLNNRENQRQYPGWNNQQIEEVIKLKETAERLEHAEEQRQQQIEQDKYIKIFQNQMDKIKLTSERFGLSISEEEELNLTKHMIDNNILPNYIFNEWTNLYEDQLDKARFKKMEEDIFKRLNKNNKTSVPNQSSNFPSKSKTNFERWEEKAKGLLYNK